MFKILTRATILFATVLTVTMAQAATKKAKPPHNDARLQACIAKCVAWDERMATEIAEDDPDDASTPAELATANKSCVPACQKDPTGSWMK